MAKIEEHYFSGIDKRNPYSGHKSRGVYDLASIPDAKVQARRNCLSSLTNLTLLKAEKDEDEESEENEETDRPVTPVNETIRVAPKTYSALCKHVRRRINPRPYWTHISIEDQRSLGAVLLGEVNAIWYVFRQQVDDPFLTTRQNKELQRRITVHIVTVCEQLFLYFCNQVKVLNARGVFSEAANMSRIRGQIALCADKYLNLLAVRRHIIADLRKTTEKPPIMVPAKKREAVTPVPPKAPRQLSFHNFMATTRTKLLTPTFNIVEEIRDMKKRMPSLDLSAATSLVPTKPSQNIFEDDVNEVKKSLDGESVNSESVLSFYERKVRKWHSEPLLSTEVVEQRKEDDGMKSPSMPSRLASPVKVSSPSALEVHPVREVSSAPPIKHIDTTEAGGDMLAEVNLRKDLENLMRIKESASNEDTYLEEDEGIPPLIQAITRREIQEEKVKKMKQLEISLDERQESYEEEQRAPLPDPKYPQPPVMEMKIPGHANPVDRKKVTIRSSDIHIPDRVELPSVSLNIHGPLYNDLTGEISASTVKDLDSNLFQGEELKEVYDEIMKTVPNDHLVFDDDPMVVKPAASANLNSILASSTLTRPQSQQIFNPNFKKKGTQPPWAGEVQDVWERNNRPSPSVRSSHSENHAIPIASSCLEITKEKTSRAFASWLAWWKATVNTDDYFKYLSTQETDFLGAIYHFYDSEVSSSEKDSVTKSVMLETEQKRQVMMSEIKMKKEHFVRGLWNVNSVTLGGLGKYPGLEEYESNYTLVEMDEEDEQIEQSSELVLGKALPPIPSDESADSESSFKVDLSDLRKSSSPRRKLRSRIRGRLVSATSDEESDGEFVARGKLSAVESDDDPETSSADSSDATTSSDKEKSTTGESEDSETDQSSEDSRTSSSSEQDLERMQGNKFLVKGSDTGDTGVDTDVSIGRASRPHRYGVGLSHDEYTSGYMSLDSNIPTPPSVQLRKRMSSRQRSIRAAEGILTQANEGAEWKVPDVVRKRLHINLLNGYYKSRTGSLATSSKISALEKTTTSTSHAASPTMSYYKPSASKIQQRFEAVWRKLKMTTSQKLNAALKYSSEQHILALDDIIKSWERVAHLIMKREKLMHDLEVFERDASDPHRFFQKGAKGSSAARLEEAKTRSRIYQKMRKVESMIAPLLHSIHVNYDDYVTFETRPYHEKMAMDKTEMLYWLQQERRCLQLDRQGESEQLKQFIRDNHLTVAKANPIEKQQLSMHVSQISIDQNT